MGDMNVSPTLTNLHDSEILRLETVVKALNDKRGKRVDMESFRQEVIDRFAEVGFKVNVQCWYVDQPDVYAFDIEIVDRMEPRPFDHSRQQWEVRQDILDLGKKEVIKMKSKKKLY